MSGNLRRGTETAWFFPLPLHLEVWMVVSCLLCSAPVPLAATDRRSTNSTNLSRYIAREQTASLSISGSSGSCWRDNGPLASLATDYKAFAVGDLITVVVVQDLTSSNAGGVSTARSFSASSGVDSLPGKIKTGGAASLLGLHSNESLTGKGQATSSSSLTTTLAGRVAAVLPGGTLVIEAERALDMNNEKQRIVLRGLVRRGDIGPNNTVASNTIGDLELEIKGKGVISDGVRPPNPLLRAILRVLNF